jgi:hypothetical protein
MPQELARWIGILGVVVAAQVGAAFNASAQASADELAKANNPLADIKAFNIQNYYIPSLYGVDNQVVNTFWFRFAAPTGPVLWRASLPLPTRPTPSGDVESGIGDFDLFAAYLAVRKPTLNFGIGPQVVAPTASNDALGSGKWQAGLATVVFAVPSPQVQLGGLLIWRASFAGDSDRSNTNVLAFQPFGFWQLGGGTYLRTAPIWAFDLKNEVYHVPFGFGIGQVTKVGKTVFNIFVEPQFTVLHNGAGQPAFQVYTALNMQFTK